MQVKPLQKYCVLITVMKTQRFDGKFLSSRERGETFRKRPPPASWARDTGPQSPSGSEKRKDLGENSTYPSETWAHSDRLAELNKTICVSSFLMEYLMEYYSITHSHWPSGEMSRLSLCLLLVAQSGKLLCGNSH